MVNLNIPGNAFRLNPSSERLESRLYELGNLAEAKRKLLNKKGSPKQRKAFLASYKKISVLAGEVIRVDEWRTKIFNLEEKLGLAKEEINHWREKFHDLEKEKEKLFEEMLSEKNLNLSCKEESELMKKYVRQLENDQFKKVRGTPIPDIKTSQARNRKIKELKTRAQKALLFCSLFGLELDLLKLKDPEGLKTYAINLSSPTSLPLPTSIDGSQSQSTDQASNQKETQYSRLSEDDKARVESILYLIDKFGVGDEFIHELSMTVEGLPKSYLFKQCRNALNESCYIKSTPGKAPAAQHSFTKLLADQIQNMVGEKVKVKLSGDGARLSRVSNFILCTLSILQSKEDLLSSKGTHTIAVVSGPENHETLAESFKEVFSEVNEIQDRGHIIVDGKQVEIELFLGGDYKFLLLVMGISAANSTYACLWCKVHKKDRGDMSKPDNFYDKDPIRRTLQEIKQFATKSKGENYCCVHQPLLNIPLDHIILDELHLMLRVTDVLISNLIEDVMQWDEKDNFLSEKKSTSSEQKHLDNLIQGIRSCGVSFSVWEKRNADGKGSGTWDWTSLMGDDRKILLKELPGKMESLIQQDTARTVVELWKGFAEMYFKFISSFEPTDIDEYHQKIKTWIDTFANLGHKRVGYTRERVTCYLHSAAYHIPNMVKKYENLKQFSGQGVEKNNDDARRIIQRKTNHTDDPADILRAEHRIRLLKHRGRKSRKYLKKATEYWENTIKEKRRNSKRLSFEKPLSNEVTENVPVTLGPPTNLTPRTRKRKRSTNKSKSDLKSKQVKK
ncbi:uncharacterized protein LOC111345047 [Stylophora pistillata]|uniref:uncharacterized protein LOC111345047 n=1 Tax=Stylophora pistillata TaxID=50429 RepID=UPI000C03942A|nr:uncharacterized protein LOC111345047 [Stylophora pistillata]